MASQYQRARRYAYWKGFAIALLVFTGWIYVSALAGRVTR